MKSEPRHCIVCGKAFAASGRQLIRKITCSTACASVRARQLRGQREGGDRDAEARLLRACVLCGAKYPADRSSRYCGDLCRDAVRREKDRAHYYRMTSEQKAKGVAARREYRKQNPEWAKRVDRRKNERIKNDPIRRAKTREQARNSYAARRLQAGLSYQTAEERSAGAAQKSASSPRPTRPCQFCGRPVRKPQARYCSPQCRQWAARKPKVSPIFSGLEVAMLADPPGPRAYFRDCEVCKTRFASSASHARFCSDACRQVSHAERKRRGPAQIPATCDICGNAFTAGKRNQKRCSPECAAEWKRRDALARITHESKQAAKFRSRQRLGITAACIICSRDMSDFEDLRHFRYTCSAECRAEAMRRKNRRSYENRRAK